MKRKLVRPRHLAGAVLAAAAVAAAVMVTSAGGALDASTAEYQYGPKLTAQPVITGTTAVGQKLTTSNGSWISPAPLTFTYRWKRCDIQGTLPSCQEIAGATSSTYTLTSADLGHRLRSYVYAASSLGTTAAYADPSPVVVNPAAPPPPPATAGTIAAASVTLPNRLVVDKTEYSQSPIRLRAPTTARFHVADSSGRSVSGALVYVLGVPYSRVRPMPEVATDASGWATVQLVPDRFFPRTGYVVLFVRARVQGQDVLAGASTRRLVQLTIAPPTG